MTAAGIDALKTLGLKPGCAEQDVTQAYRRLARKRHPDKGGNKEDFQRLRAAYELLTTIGIPDAPSAPAAKQATPAPAANPFAKMWAEAQRLSAEERLAAKRAAAQRASMSGTERAREETRRRKRQREEEERRHAEEWEELRREQAQQRAASAANFQQRRNKWAAQHRAHISGVSYDMQAEALELRRWLRMLQKSRVPEAPRPKPTEPPPKMARVLRGRASSRR
mmetsp:Transcript_80611/g.127333  ORF Transcript_80611/g.127333 Transcript_80611/m.127333 type:complete len:224 (-) Transcript_80611:125-796(-)